MKQHTVPQNIMSVEFKIFGDLSVRQFIYVTIAGGFAFIIYLTILPGIVKFPLIIASILIGILVTFAKINERPFDVWITNFITAVLMPTQRVWIKKHEMPYFLTDDESLKVEKKRSSTRSKFISKSLNIY